MTTLYDTLGVPKDATTDEIRRAFRHLARTHHPDAGGTTEAFQGIEEAERILADPEKRARYDATGKTDSPPQDPVEAMALAMVDQAITLAIAQVDGERQGPLGAARSAIKDAQWQNTANMTAARADLFKIERVRDRLSTKGPEDPVRAMLASKADRIRTAIDGMETQDKALTRALAILAAYTFRVDAGVSTNDTGSFAQPSFFVG